MFKELFVTSIKNSFSGSLGRYDLAGENVLKNLVERGGAMYAQFRCLREYQSSVGH